MRFSIKIVGEAGQGVLSMGAILAKALKRSNLYVLGYRENPSLIKGGITTYQIDVDNKPVFSLQDHADIIVSICKAGVKQRFYEASQDGLVIHPFEKLHITDKQQAYQEEKNITVTCIDVPEFLKEQQLAGVFGNMYLLGHIWKTLGIDYAIVEEVMKEWFASKPALLEKDLVCLQSGFNDGVIYENKNIASICGDAHIADHYLLDGTEAIALGAIHAGCRAYFAYPMSPASNILLNMSKYGTETGAIVKQAEDEITAACMVIGASHMGTRAFTATSGGGFDLMTEAVSMACITETPFVCVLGQRPGPATGLPTWTTQADLMLSIFSAHGESPKCVIALSDVRSSFEMMGEAFNIAEKYQMVVIVLADKYGLEAHQQIDSFPEGTIDRGKLITDVHELMNLSADERYDMHEPSGITKRWVPGDRAPVYDANTDEHIGDGTTTEESIEAVQALDKRMRKLDVLKNNLPDPTIYGPESGDILFVGWGTTQMVMKDILERQAEFNIDVSYLHYEYLWPLRTDCLQEIFSRFKKIVLVEGNKTGQLELLIKQESDFPVKFDDRLLKYDGRPFFLDDIIDYIQEGKPITPKRSYRIIE